MDQYHDVNVSLTLVRLKVKVKVVVIMFYRKEQKDYVSLAKTEDRRYKAEFVYDYEKLNKKNKKKEGPRFEMGNKWGNCIYIEDSRLCFGLCLGPSYVDKIAGFVYNILAGMYNLLGCKLF